jgi:membrane protein YqaA with SNARE-associated domain
VRAFFFSILGYFLTPFGLTLMGFMDASLVFFFPLGIDFVVILMAARKPDLFWLYTLLATIGSVAGAAMTFWIGRKVGEHGLGHFVGERRLQRISQKVGGGAGASVAMLAIVPPPFPFTPFVMTSGALGVNAWAFLGILTCMRAIRFAIEAALARRYGTGIIGWMKTPSFKMVVGAFILLALVGTVVSAVALVRSSRRGGAKSDSEEGPPPRRTARAATHPR